jgi:hypothetical protein
MENTIDLRKTGAENIIGKFDRIPTSPHIIPVRERGSYIVGANIYMSARQAEAILMLSDFIEGAPFDHDEDKNSEAYATRTNTLHELAMIVRTMAKCVVVAPSSLSLRDIAVNYGHVKGDEFHSY